MNSAVTLARVVHELDDMYPPAFAEGWDAIGLVAGDPAAQVRKVLFAVDPVAAVVDEALDWGADLLVTHHPLFLRAVHSVAASTFKGLVVHRLIRGECALYHAHTNADAATCGVADALADALGLLHRMPLVPHPAPAPTRAGKRPVPATTGAGRVGRLAHPMTLREFAQFVAAALPATAQGVRVAGDLDATVENVAVSGGSGDGFFDAVRECQADVYVTADLRHHPASELRERAMMEGGAAGIPFLVDVAHFASEWPWLRCAARNLTMRLAPRPAGAAPCGAAPCGAPAPDSGKASSDGKAPSSDKAPSSGKAVSDGNTSGGAKTPGAGSAPGAAAAAPIETRVSTIVTDPWTAHFASPLDPERASPVPPASARFSLSGPRDGAFAEVGP